MQPDVTVVQTGERGGARASSGSMEAADSTAAYTSDIDSRTAAYTSEPVSRARGVAV